MNIRCYRIEVVFFVLFIVAIILTSCSQSQISVDINAGPVSVETSVTETAVPEIITEAAKPQDKNTFTQKVGFIWKTDDINAISNEISNMQRDKFYNYVPFEWYNVSVTYPEGWTEKDGYIYFPGGTCTRANNWYQMFMLPEDIIPDNLAADTVSKSERVVDIHKLDDTWCSVRKDTVEETDVYRMDYYVNCGGGNIVMFPLFEKDYTDYNEDLHRAVINSITLTETRRMLSHDRGWAAYLETESDIYDKLIFECEDGRSYVLQGYESDEPYSVNIYGGSHAYVTCYDRQNEYTFAVMLDGSLGEVVGYYRPTLDEMLELFGCDTAADRIASYNIRTNYDEVSGLTVWFYYMTDGEMYTYNGTLVDDGTITDVFHEVQTLYQKTGPTDDEVMDSFYKAYDILGWVKIDMPLSGGFRYYENYISYMRFRYKAITGMASMRKYIGAYLSPERMESYLDETLNETVKRYIEHDGLILSYGGTRGTSENMGKPEQTITRVTDDKIILSLKVPLGEFHGGANEVTGYENHEFVYEKIGGIWVWSKIYVYN